MSDEDGQGEYLYLAPAGEVAAGKMKCYELEGRSVLLCNGAKGLFAVENRCSHEKTPLDEGRLRGSRVVCPIHGASFDLETGKALGPPAVLPIAAFPMKIEDDKIYIKLVPTPKPPSNPFAIPR